MLKFRICAHLFLLTGCLLPVAAQQVLETVNVSPSNVAVPPFVNFNGTLTDPSGKPLTGSIEITFSLFRDREGGDPLWTETQNVEADESGHYSAMLGAKTSSGLSPEIFAAGEARWLEVQVQGQPQQPRILLMSVPYALKAADAETVGGLPPSAFVMAGSRPADAASAQAPAPGAGASTVTTPGGIAKQLARFDSGTDIVDSIVTDTGTAVGINTTSPASTLDVNGTLTIRGGISLPSTGTASATEGKVSQPLNQTASTFNSSTGKEEKQWFQWQVEPVHNNTFAPAGVMSLLTSQNGNTPAETGLKINQAGQITFAPGQTFPLTTPAGTITGVIAGTDLTGGGTSGNVTLNVDTTRVATLNSSNNGQFFISGNNGGAVVNATQAGLGNGVSGVAEGPNGTGVFGSGAAAGVAGTVLSTTGTGVLGTGGSSGVGVKGTSTNGTGLLGTSTTGTGVSGSGFTGVSGSGTLRGVFSVGTGTGSSGVVSFGQNFGLVATADAATGKTMGVAASSSSPTGTGTLSYAVGESHVGSGGIGCCAVGVWGDTNQTTGGAAGLVGTADDAQAIFLANNSVNHLTANINNYENTAHNVEIVDIQGSFGSCNFNTDGTETCTGRVFGVNGLTSEGEFLADSTALVFGNLFVDGTKSSVVPVDNGTRKVALYAVEAPENWFEDYGGGRLEDGRATIALEPVFQQTVNTNMEYRVFLTPKGDCEGLYVTNETPQGFEVRELHGGRSSVEFDYRILARRKGYENLRLADRTEEEKRARAETARHTEKSALADRDDDVMRKATQRAVLPGPAAELH